MRFGSLRSVKPIIQSLTQIERQLQEARSPQADQAMKGYESPSVRNLLKSSGGDLGKASSPGSRALSDARNAMNNKAKGAKFKPGCTGGLRSLTVQSSHDNPSNSVYEFLIQELIKHLHSGQVFEEV